MSTPLTNLRCEPAVCANVWSRGGGFVIGIASAKNMTRSRFKDHPWLNMTNEQIVRSSGLILRDQASGKEGITLAAILFWNGSVNNVGITTA